jgi:hypothetical protein
MGQSLQGRPSGKSDHVYIAVFEGSGSKLPIKSVLIGPHANQDNQETAVKLYLINTK